MSTVLIKGRVRDKNGAEKDFKQYVYTDAKVLDVSVLVICVRFQ